MSTTIVHNKAFSIEKASTIKSTQNSTNATTNTTTSKDESFKQPLVGDAAVRKFLTAFQDSYISAVNLDNYVKIGSGSYAVVWKCNLKNNNSNLIYKFTNLI